MLLQGINRLFADSYLHEKMNAVKDNVYLFINQQIAAPYAYTVVYCFNPLSYTDLRRRITAGRMPHADFLSSADAWRLL